MKRLFRSKLSQVRELNDEKAILLGKLRIALDTNQPYSAIGDSIKEINSQLLMVREMPDR